MEGFRAVFDPQAGPVSVPVLGFHHDIGAVTGTPTAPDWFCFVFETPVPVLVDGALVDSGAGSLMIHAPGEPIRQGVDGSWCRSWIRFTGEDPELLLARCGLRTGVCYRVGGAVRHARWLLAIATELRHPLGGDAHTVADLIACWWRDVARAAGATRLVPAAILDARRIIERDFAASLGLDGLARAVGLSRTHLCRSFRAAYGTTPMRYARRLRLQQAAELLDGSDLAVGDIAVRCGFADVYHFSRAFRNAYGLAPTRFRQREEARPSPPDHRPPS